MENKKIVRNSEWLDDVTFVVNFEPTPTTEDFELEGVTEEVVVEYHKDEHKWVVDKQYFDADGGFIDHDTDAFTPYEKAEYLTIAEGIHNNFKSNDSWEEIVVADNYETYDALVDSIKRYYASLNGDSDEVAYEVEDIISYRFMELLSELDKKGHIIQPLAIGNNLLVFHIV